MTYTSLFGQVTGRSDVQNAVISTLQAWIVPMLAEVERQEGLTPRTIPPPGGAVYPPLNTFSLRGGIDFERWTADQLPLLIVVAQPTGNTEPIAPSTYQQWYEVQIAAVCEDANGSEQVATQQADWYGKALSLILAQDGGMGTRVDTDGSTIIPFAERTTLEVAPRTEFIPDAPRSLARSVVVAHLLPNGAIVDGSQGPRTPPADPYAVPGVWPTVTTVDVQLQSKNPLGVASASTGVNVTDSTGHVVVNE